MRKKTLRIISLLGLVVIVSVIYVITSRFALPRQAASPAASPTAYPTTDATVTPIQPAVVQAAQIQSIPTHATGIFGLKQVPRESIDEYGLYATALPDFSTQTYHLILAAFGTEDKFPDIQLYHSENGLIEKLPFQETWLSGFSQDGLWLLMYSYPDSGGYSILLRRVEKPDDGWHLLASDISYPNWNTNWSQVAYGHTRNNQIIWQTFPEGENLGCWDTDPYNTSQIIFSPDGSTLLTLGNRPGERGDGLFALNRCLPSPTPTLPPPQTQDFTMLADAKAAARFTILAPAFVPEGLFLDKVTVMDYEDGSQTVQITYAEDYTGEILDANRKFVFVWLTSGGSPVTLDSLKSTFKEVAWDILPVTVRGQAGFSYWMPANAAGNSAWLAWNEGDLTISIAMYGDWPQPTEADPHRLDGILFNIAKSLK
jgi:hypothetical protein